LSTNNFNRQKEQRLIEEKEVAEKAREAQGKFLANVSHEIRTPIQTVIGMIDLLSDTSLDREQTEYCRQIKFSADILLSLINDVLDYSKIEAEKMELENIDFDLEEVLEQTVDMITLEAHSKGLCIATNIPLETNIIIKGDPGKFRQVVLNLAKNAVKFTSEGMVTISTSFSKLATPGGAQETLRVSVADTGIGIDKKTQERLFSKFMQADASNARCFGGTGLGLAISRSLVELMGGKIEMVPNPGGGSIFRFDIPIQRSDKKPEPLPPPEESGKIKILVVDASCQKRAIIAANLHDLGYTNISQAACGESALTMLRGATTRRRPFRICFIDMKMPVMDGWRLAAEIHNDTRIKPADLVLMEPRGLLGAEAKMTLLKWFKAYIYKPVKRRSLAETISYVLNEPQELESAVETEEQKNCRKTCADIRFADNCADNCMEESKPLILIAEDHLVNQKLFSVILQKLGYPFVLADDGQDALEKSAASDTALIFMDIQMPRMNGYDAAQALRKRGYQKPVIAITASALPDERERCLKAGIDDILVKPFKQSCLEKMLLKWLTVRDAQPVAFNSGELLNTFLHDKETAVPLIDRFIERTQAQLLAIPALEKAADWESARRESHTIRGAASTMGGAELGRAAARLELAHKNADKHEMKAAYPPLLEAFERYKKEAQEFLYAR